MPEMTSWPSQMALWGLPGPAQGFAHQAWVAGLWMVGFSLHPWCAPTRPKVPHALSGLG